ncbi:HNH endonuclease [Nocardioides sp. NPDC058538]|uniref:HNH endonuclease n=1 Tax=Nocardioides sp. NPDC058538 TaxID=3346542 RepID=UPI00365DBFF6
MATATWAEAHHWLAWAQGGGTDLDNAALLCSHHHHRAHDTAYPPRTPTQRRHPLHQTQIGRGLAPATHRAGLGDGTEKMA